MATRTQKVNRAIVLLTAAVTMPLLMPRRALTPRFISPSLLVGGPSAAAARQAPQNKGGGVSAEKERLFLRKFTWQSISKAWRETEFHLSEKDIKKETRSFGVPHGEKSSFFIKKMGYLEIAPNLYIINYRQIYQRNREYFPALSSALLLSSALPPGEEPLFAFLLFVQQIQYKRPPKYYEGRFIDCFFTPLICLYEQYGDCDSKSLLLAEFLTTLPGAREKVAMIVASRFSTTHSILAVDRKPLPGMTTLYNPGKGYFIPLETSAPGWSPGFISRNVAELIRKGKIFFIDLN